MTLQVDAWLRLLKEVLHRGIKVTEITVHRKWRIEIKKRDL